MEKTTASIYDFPVYYDLVFGSDCAAEMAFLHDLFERYVDGKVKRLFEPACGTGRLIYRLGREGYEVSGNDLNEKAIDFCNKRLERHELKGRAFVGDMSDFTVKKPYDAAFNTINSFRHLPTEQAAIGHLKCMAEAVRPGGIYALGLHLTPTRGEASDEESWSARRGQLAINTFMWAVDKNPRKRMEQFGIKFDVYKPTGHLQIQDVLKLRSYTAKQFKELLSAAPQWEAVETYDFHYDIRRPIKIDAETEDIVVILKRK
ncbi:MAG: class I SAM-dependent methyltransferase [Pirellulaceae bacterium]|nr:class I SAM-dependent methyltransferase [Pirellulaceae bacterium]